MLFSLDNITILIIGFFTASTGMILGVILAYATHNLSKRFKGTILGCSGGLILAVICFDLLPESLEVGNIFLSSLGITIGLLIVVALEGTLDSKPMPELYNKAYYIRAASLLSIGIGLHNIPAGIALGSLFSISFVESMHLAVALILDGIPEGFAVGIFLKGSGLKFSKIFLLASLTSAPMGAAALVGVMINNQSPAFTSIILAITCGMILYVLLRDTFPEARETWRGSLSSVGTVVGFIMGIIIINILDL